MVSPLINSKNPALVLATPAGGAVGTLQLCRKAQVPMAVSVAGGVARTHLFAVGSNPGPAIEVPERVDGHQLATALNALRDRETVPLGEVDAFHFLLAAATEQAFEQGQRSLAGVS